MRILLESMQILLFMYDLNRMFSANEGQIQESAQEFR